MPAEFDIGFLGGGQLARMSIQAAQRMGLKCLSLDPSADSPASQIAPAITGSLDDRHAVSEVFRRCDRVTLENEFIPARAIDDALLMADEARLKSTPALPPFGVQNLVPSTQALGTIQDKLLQRQALARAGVPSPHAVAMDGDETIDHPMVLKARFGGYDGKGTRYAKTPDELESHRHLWGGGGWLAEEFVPFARELAVMVVRTNGGAFAFPTMETVQTRHVCDLVFPCDADGSEVALAAVEAIGGFGLFGVELFELEDGKVLVNEIAPRPHNTGHYTLDWEAPSQFEIHVRAVMGLPIGPIQSNTKVVMANLLGQTGAGDYRQGVAACMRHEGARFHWYGKAEAKVGRKMGHINVVGKEGEETASIVERAVRAREDFYAAWTDR